MAADRRSAGARDRAVARVRALGWGVAAGVAALSGGLSVVAAQAFKGHDGRAKTATHAAAVTKAAPRQAPVQVPAPQHVPAIAGSPPAPPIQPPPSAPSAPAPTPQAAPVQPAPAPAPAPVPQVQSGGS